MPNLTISVPANLVAEVTAVADEYLDAHAINRAGLTVSQRGQAYIAAILRDVVIARRRATAQATAQAAVDAAIATAATDAAAIT